MLASYIRTICTSGGDHSRRDQYLSHYEERRDYPRLLGRPVSIGGGRQDAAALHVRRAVEEWRYLTHLLYLRTQSAGGSYKVIFDLLPDVLGQYRARRLAAQPALPESMPHVT